MLTVEQKKRLAKEARKLAMECVNGVAPAFGVKSLDTCGVGVVIARARLSHYDVWLCGSSYDYMEMMRIVAAANDSATDKERGSAVVFPLLALADALEEQIP